MVVYHVSLLESRLEIMNKINELNEIQIKAIKYEFNQIKDLDNILLPYHEHDLHNGGWKILPLSFCGKITDIGKKYLRGTCNLLSSRALTLSIHVIEPGCIIAPHIDDDFGFVIERFHLNISNWNPEESSLIGGKIENDQLAIKFDTTVSHAVHNDSDKRLIFIIADYDNYNELKFNTLVDLFRLYKKAGYF